MRIMKAAFGKLPPQYSPELSELVAKLLCKDPRGRPSVNEVLRRPLVQKRVEDLLSESMRKCEFSHTVLHGSA